MNRIKHTTLLLLCLGLNSLAQTTISQAEYFWDNDPGQGSGTALFAQDQSFDSSIENFFELGIPVPTTGGLHTFNVRAKASDGQWGPVFKQVVQIDNAAGTPNLAEAEYFWDNDPGQGNGTPLFAADQVFDSAIENFNRYGIELPTANGLHKFCVRAKDSNGQWGPIHTQIIDRSNALLGNNAIATIVEAEYFWDADPGQGAGTSFSPADQNFDASIENLLQSGIPIAQPVGLHVFNARAKDNFGNWGPVHKQVIYIETTLATEHFDMSKLVVYPNPVKNVLNVGYEQEITSVAVYNVLGQEVILKSIKANEGQIDVSGLRQGTYVVKVTSADQTKTLKIIKE